MEPQLEQFDEEQLEHDELAVLAGFPLTEKEQADIIRLTLRLLHFGQGMISEDLKTSFSNSWRQ